MKIASFEIKHGLFLAPMAGEGDRAFRTVCREFGAEYTVSEMVSAKAVHYKDKKTDELAKITDAERPMAVQIFGSEPDIMAEAASVIAEKYSPAAIDINMGCPVNKIVSNNEGSALMKNPKLAGEIVTAVKKAVSIPVTVKIRSGWDENSKNAVEVAKTVEAAGADAVCVHGRTRAQLYAPPADLNIIKEVKAALSVPVIGNGDIFSADDAMRMFEYTGCDGIAVARGALGNPYIFAEIIARLEGKSYTPPTIAERLVTAKRQLALAASFKGERVAVAESRKYMSHYIKGCEGAARLRREINAAETIEQMEAVIAPYFENN